jgi:hypothetical protein
MSRDDGTTPGTGIWLPAENREATPAEADKILGPGTPRDDASIRAAWREQRRAGKAGGQ